MYLSTYKKLNLARIIIFTAVYVIYTLFNVVSGRGIKIVSELMLAASLVNAAFSLTILFSDDEDKNKILKRRRKKVKRLLKLIANVLKLFILIGSVVFYFDEKDIGTLCWTIVIIAISVLGCAFDLIKAVIVQTTEGAKISLSYSLERLKKHFGLSKKWKSAVIEGKKCEFLIGEDAPFYTRLLLRSADLADGTVVNYKGSYVYYESPESIKLLTGYDEYRDDYAYIRSHVKDISDKFSDEENPRY